MHVLKQLSSAILFCIIVSCNQKKDEKKISIPIDSAVNVLQKNPYSGIDQSPLDQIYFPENYPQLRMEHADTIPLMARVIYSRPHKKGRIIFGKENALCPYGKPWRLGANEATEIELFRPVLVAGKNLAAGSYVLYCIPYADHWTMVFNSNLHTWGLHIDSSLDVLKVDVPTETQSPALEDFTMIFEKSASGANLLMAWDNVKAFLPIEFSVKQ